MSVIVKAFYQIKFAEKYNHYFCDSGQNTDFYWSKLELLQTLHFFPARLFFLLAFFSCITYFDMSHKNPELNLQSSGLETKAHKDQSSLSSTNSPKQDMKVNATNLLKNMLY